MIIYSWNMLFRNKELERAFLFIQEAEFDFFCLQEVPEIFLKQLQTLPYFIAYRIDTERVLKTSIIPMYNVILSKYPIVHQDEIVYEDTWNTIPLRTRLFIFIMKPFHFSKAQNRGGVYIDVIINGEPLRVFDLHLALAHPTQRLRELEVAMLRHDIKRNHIICGDFNIVEFPHVATLNWLLGGRISDALLYKRERTYIENYFSKKQLLNPLRGTVTHPFSRSQLDHILVSKSFSIKNASVLSDRIGSDHCIIRVETD